MNAVQLLSPSVGDAEARHHLVEDKHGSLLGREIAQALEKPRTRWNTTHVAGDGLDDRRRELALMDAKHLVQRANVVVRRGDGELGQRARHAGAIGQAERGDAGARLHQQAVSVAVIAPYEFQYLLAAACGPRRLRSQAGDQFFRDGVQSLVEARPAQ